MASIGGPKLICLLFVLLTILHSVNSGCGWAARSKQGDEDYDDEEDKYGSIDADHDDDDDEEGSERHRNFQGRSLSGNYGDRDDYDHGISDEDDEDEYTRYGKEYVEKKKSRKFSDGSDEDRKYREDKSLKPSERCHRNGGYCMKGEDRRCKGEIRLFQTNCIDECECCMDGKEQVEARNIEIVRRRRDWQGARDECRDLGGDLLVPKSVGELLYQLKKNQMSSHRLWIGISDTRRPGLFRGIQGNHIRAGWQNKEPRPREVGDDCVVVQHRSDAKRGMRVRRCREEHYFICDLSSEYRSDHTVRY